MPRTIVHLIATNFLGGPERQILGHLDALDRAAYDPVVASFREGERPNELLKVARERGHTVWEIEERHRFDWALVSRLRRRLRESRVALLCCHGYKAHAIGSLAVPGLGIPLLPVVHGLTGENRRVRAYEWVHRRLLRRTAMVVTVSHASKQSLVHRGLRASDIEVIHNAIDVPAIIWRATDGDPAALTASLGLPRDCRLIVSVGRLSPEKGHRYLVAAAPRIIAAVPDARCVLIGEGAEARRLERQIASLGLNGLVALAGFRSDVPTVLKVADVFVLPSLSEGLPVAALEALAAGVPIVATAAGGTPEVVLNEHTGLLVPPRDPARLAQATVRLLREADLAARLAREGRQLVEREFTFEAQARKLEAAYHACIEGHVSGAGRALPSSAYELHDEH